MNMSAVMVGFVVFFFFKLQQERVKWLLLFSAPMLLGLSLLKRMPVVSQILLAGKLLCTEMTLPG